MSVSLTDLPGLPDLPDLADDVGLVSAHEAQASVAAARFQVAFLVDAVRRAEAEADDLEGQIVVVDHEGIDEVAVLNRVESLLERLALEAADRRQAAVERARVEAEARRDVGRAEFDRIRRSPVDAAPGETPAPVLVAVAPQADEIADAGPVVDLADPSGVIDLSDPAVGEVGDVDLSGLDLSELAELVPVLASMLRGEDLAAPVESKSLESKPVEPTPVEAMPAAPAVEAADPASGDADERFRNFWESDVATPVEEPEPWWLAMPTPLVGVIAVALLLILVLTFI